MKVVSISIDKIDVQDRTRPVNPAVAGQLAEDVIKRGLRQPVEVARVARSDKYILISGAHRLEACRIAGWTEISASIVEANKAERLRDELMENLARSELTMLERAQLLWELKKNHKDMTGATRGGDRKSIDFKDKNQTANLAIWFGQVAVRSGSGVRTIERAASIGEHLSPSAAGRLRGTSLEENQQELELLSKQGHSRQTRIVDLLLRKPDPVPGVAEAIRIIDGRASAGKNPIGKAVERAISQWTRSPAFRTAFIAAVPDEHLAPLLAKRGYVRIKDIK